VILCALIIDTHFVQLSGFDCIGNRLQFDLQFQQQRKKIGGTLSVGTGFNSMYQTATRDAYVNTDLRPGRVLPGTIFVAKFKSSNSKVHIQSLLYLVLSAPAGRGGGG
jgi:hypothetical protein